MEINSLRLLIIADDPLTRAGLAALLDAQPNCTVVGKIAGDTNLLANLEMYQPDVLLWDLGWDPESMLEQLADLRDLDLPSVVLLSDAAYTAEAWSTGVKALLLRAVNEDRLVAALLAAAQDLVTLDPEITPLLLPNVQNSVPPPVESLTPRELEVLQHLAQGLPNKTIAHQLNISEHTVKFHVNASMSKLGAQSRTEAVVRATQLGLILL